MKTSEERYPVSTEQLIDLAYALYKFDWRQKHQITLEDNQQIIKDYYEYLRTCKSRQYFISLEEYIDRFGYPTQDGVKSYLSKQEFINSNEISYEYMQYLLPQEILNVLTNLGVIHPEPIYEQEPEPER